MLKGLSFQYVTIGESTDGSLNWVKVNQGSVLELPWANVRVGEVTEIAQYQRSTFPGLFDQSGRGMNSSLRALAGTAKERMKYEL